MILLHSALKCTVNESKVECASISAWNSAIIFLYTRVELIFKRGLSLIQTNRTKISPALGVFYFSIAPSGYEEKILFK